MTASPTLGYTLMGNPDYELASGRILFDGADISATTDEYLSYLGKCGSDYSNFADSSTYSTSGISSEPYILTQVPM